MRCYPFLGNFVITSPFGPRNAFKTTEGYASTDHKGIDIVGQQTMGLQADYRACVACESGRVTKVSTDKYLGKWVFVTLDSGYGNIYQHLASINVKVGDRVLPKQVLGIMGATGNVSGAHLHFGVTTNSEYISGYYNNKWIDPAKWFGMRTSAKGTVYNGEGYVTGGTAADKAGKTTEITNIVAKDETAKGSSQTAKDTSGAVTTTTAGYTDALVPSGQFFNVKITGTTRDILFGRRYRILIGIGNGQAFDVSELRCTFEITKMIAREPTQSVVNIYNLNPNDENKLIRGGQQIIIEAGYEGSQYGVIFTGNIIQALRSKESATDYVLTLVSMEAERFITYGLIGVALVAQQSSRDAVQAIMTKSSHEAGAGFITDTKVIYPRGKVMFGQSRDYLDQISRSMNATYYTEDGKVNLITAKDVDNGEILSFGPDSGLLGSPVQNELGISCEVLLNPQVKLNTLFHVDNKKIQNFRYQYGKPVRSLDSQGVYRVIKLTHTGDTRGSDWKTSIDAISQAGVLPSMSQVDGVWVW